MKQMKRLCMITLLLTMTVLGAMAQDLKVKGTVVQKSDNEPVIGATVQVVGTQTATITDIDGNFQITAPQDAQIQFSYVGMKTITLAAAAEMAVALEDDATVMQEVVVTGYTTQRKADLTGAVSVVSVTDLQKQNENNPMKALQGRVPGMNISADGSPSGAATVRIRGVGTLNDNDPLYIIDGVPTKSGMHELNGNDIESIQVLKDAASASIYGSRAANGVIIITTKKGKEGRLKIDLDASIAASLYVKKVKTLNAREWGQAFWQANVNDGKDPNNNNLGYRFDWGYDANGNPVLNNVMMNSYLDDNATVHAGDNDWFDQVTRTGIVQNYNVSVSNGSEKGSSFFSMGYYKNLGTIKNSDFNRISVRANTDYKFFDGVLTLGENFNMNRTSGVDAPGGVLENSLEFNPNFPVYAENGEYAQSLGAYSERENPLSLLDNKKDDRYTQWRTFGDVHVCLNLGKGFNIRSTFGLDYTQKEQRFFTYPIANGKVTRTENAVESKQEHWTRWTWNALATYNFEKGNHRGDALLGTEVNRQDYKWMSAKRYEYAVLNPDYMWPSAGSGRQEALGSGDGFSLVSYFGKINYTYADKYMASATVRYDGSSRFGKNNRYGVFPSFSLGWRITQEKFMESTSSWLSDLKLRYSWGQTGNQEISNTARYTLFQSVVTTGLWGAGQAGTAYDVAGTNGGYALTNGYIRAQRGNEDIKWETTAQHNIGLDFSVMGGDIYGSFDYFDKRTKDILVAMDGIGAMGEGTSMWVNAGEMKNNGFEFTVGYRHKLENGFSWDISGNIGSYKNEITKLPETIAAKGTFGGNGVKSVVGHPMGAQVGYVYDGIFKSQEEVDNHASQEGAAVGRIRYKDIDSYDADGNLTGIPDGKIDTADRDWIYNPTPAFTWGLNIYLQYRNFDITMFWQGVQNVDVMAFDMKTRTDFWANSAINVPYLNKGNRVLDAWSPTNTNSEIPMLTTTDNNLEGSLSSYYVENGSYAKLRNIQLGYNFSKDVAQKLKMERIRCYVSAQNLLTIKASGFTGVDPENPGFGYPIPLNITAGVNVTF